MTADKTATVAEALAAVMGRVVITGTGCWEWQGAKSSNGYGQICIDGSQHGVHRYVYALMHGAAAVRGLVIDHLCRNRACCNPDHLEAVPQRTNIERGVNAVAGFMDATHCIHGHEFTTENTYRTSRGARNCRTCVRDNMRRFRARKKSTV